MATYSAFFSSGLLAPYVARATTPVPPSSPMLMSASPADPTDRQLSVTPTPIGHSPCTKASEAHINGDRPRMRRRRSSIKIGASPMALIKSPSRNAGAALQRTGIMSPTRSRAGSVSTNEASENNSLFGRLRSGSVGGVPRTRRAVRRTVPLAPPPTAPLPALPPPSPTAKYASRLAPPAILVPVPRQPLSARLSVTDNVGNLFSPTLPSPTLLSPDYAPKMSFKMSPSLTSSPAIPERTGYYGDIIDEEMKEN
ncbi:hypothetical protein HYDPIDRAFT_174860 [Hydnomerulius pinastri MD-312]|nr:hypothetical protein HYDPIDRAFT_174860 [Hydnomerulius pinastri MD-312]